MTYLLKLAKLPTVSEATVLHRDTVWKCSDSQNVLITVVNGSCSVHVGNRDYRLDSGSCVIIPAGADYERRPVSGESAELIYIHFDCQMLRVRGEEKADRLRSQLLSDGADDGLVVGEYTSLDDKEELERLFMSVVEEKRDQRPLGGVAAGLALSRLLLELSRVQMAQIASIKVAEETLAFPMPLQKALDYLKDNYSRKVTVPELCGVANVTPQHLIRLFNRYIGVSPIRYINRGKILSAVNMLRVTEKSVKEISYELGFDNPNYFSRIFTREVGCSPSEKRIQIRSYEKNDRK